MIKESISSKVLKLAALAVLLVALAFASLTGPVPAFADGSSSSSSSSAESQSAESASSDMSGLDADTVALIRQLESLSTGDYETVRAELESLLASLSAYGDAVNASLNELVSTLQVVLAVLGFFGTLVTALLAEWLFRRQTLGAAEMIRERTGATIGSGVIGAIAIPLLAILLTCLAVTLPVAGGVVFGALSLSSVAAGFMGASLFKLVFKKMGRFKCALAGGAIVGVAGAIPYLGVFVSAVAFIYLLGYVLQSIYLGMRNPSSASEAAVAEAQPDGEPKADELEAFESEPKASESEPEVGEAETDELEVAESEPEVGEVETGELEVAESEPEASESGTDEAETDELKVDESEPETSDSEVVGAEAGEPESK